MYAVIKTGGHQYRVQEGETLTIEKLEGNPGDTLSFSDVLMLQTGDSCVVGKPLVEGASVEAKICDQNRADKVIVFKYKRRKNYKKKRGHKQHHTVVEISKINA